MCTGKKRGQTPASLGSFKEGVITVYIVKTLKRIFKKDLWKSPLKDN